MAEYIRRNERAMNPDIQRRFHATMAYFNLLWNGDGRSKKDRALVIANSVNKGPHFARNVMKWANLWLGEGTIPETHRAVVANKARSWLEDEGVSLAAREHVAQMGPSKRLSSQGLAIL